MAPLDFAVEAGLFAVLLGLVVLLALFEEPVRRIVVSWMFLRLESVRWVFWWRAVA